LNIQVEHLDNHIARLAVTLDAERLLKAKESAARKIGQKVNIPGFRRGKAPYKIVARFVGEAAILEEAVEQLGNELYPQALKESGVNPYGMGSLEDVTTDPTIQLIFTVAKQATVELGGYRTIRLPYEPPSIEDKDVNAALNDLLDSRALVEPATRSAQLGDMIVADVHGEVIHPEHEHDHNHDHAAEGDTPAEANTEGEAEPKTPKSVEERTEPFIDREKQEFLLYTPEQGEDRDPVPGFSAQLVGLGAGESKAFTISFAEDHEDKALAGHAFKFEVTIHEVKARTLPTLNDAFAETVLEGKYKTLLDLRIGVRKDLETAAQREVTRNYSSKVLAEAVKGATVQYPEAMVEDYTSNLLRDLDENLRRQNLSLARLMQIQGKDEAALRKEYRETAVSRLINDVVVKHLLEREAITVTPEALTTRMDEMASRFSSDEEQAKNFRRFLEQNETKTAVAADLLLEGLQERLAAIGRGDDLPEVTLPATAGSAVNEAAGDVAAAAEAAVEASLPSEPSSAGAAEDQNA